MISRVVFASLMAVAMAGTFAGTAMAQGQGGRNRPAQQPPAQPQTGPDGLQKREERFPQNVTWTATAINGKPVSGASRPSLQLDGNFRLRGFGGCNTYSATAYPLREQKLAVGPVALTKRACDKATMDAEKLFLTALRQTDSWTYDQGALVLKTDRGVTLRFERTL